jgi:hypothetical protein
MHQSSQCCSRGWDMPSPVSAHPSLTSTYPEAFPPRPKICLAVHQPCAVRYGTNLIHRTNFRKICLQRWLHRHSEALADSRARVCHRTEALTHDKDIGGNIQIHNQRPELSRPWATPRRLDFGLSTTAHCMKAVSESVGKYLSNAIERTKCETLKGQKGSCRSARANGIAADAGVTDVVESQLALGDIYPCIVSAGWLTQALKDTNRC